MSILFLSVSWKGRNLESWETTPTPQNSINCTQLKIVYNTQFASQSLIYPCDKKKIIPSWPCLFSYKTWEHSQKTCACPTKASEIPRYNSSEWIKTSLLIEGGNPLKESKETLSLWPLLFAEIPEVLCLQLTTIESTFAAVMPAQSCITKGEDKLFFCIAACVLLDELSMLANIGHHCSCNPDKWISILLVGWKREC